MNAPWFCDIAPTIFGADELSRGEVAVKALREPAAAQVARRIDQLGEWAPLLRNA
jgi:hypothetical protein